MLKSLTAVVAFLCLGPPSLPPAPPAALTLPPEAVQELVVSSPAVADPAPPPSPARVFQGPLAVVRFPPKLRGQLDHLVQKYAQQHGVDENLVRAVLRQESGGNPVAVSPKGAMGLMQLMPETAVFLGVADPFDPEQNLAGGVKYLKLCLKRFQDNPVLALAAYNAGPEAVARYGGCPPYRETLDYVARVMASYTGKPWTNPRGAHPRLAPPAPEEASSPSGLNWRIPAPAWRIATSQAKVSPPRWKVRPLGLPQAQQGEASRQVSLRPPDSQNGKAQYPLGQTRGFSTATP